MVDRAERFLFAPVDTRAAAIFRVALAVMLVVVFRPRNASWLAAIGEHLSFGDSPTLMVPTVPYLLVVLVLVGVFAAGRATRVVGLSLVPLLWPLYLVNPQIGPQLMLLTLLSFSLLPPASTRPDVSAPAATGPMWPIRLVQLEITAVYAVNAFAKATPEYASGDVLVGMSRMLPNFVADLSDGRWHVGAFAIPAALLAVGSIAVEAFLAVGFWIRPLRGVTAAVGVAFHLLARRLITIGMLDWVCVFTYLAFLLPFERDAARSAAPRNATIAPAA